MRDAIGIGICVLSAAWGAIAIHRGWVSNFSNVATDVAGVWIIVGAWLGDRFTRKEWARLNKPMSAIFEDAKRGRLPKDKPLVRALNWGGFLLFTVGIVSLFR